MTTLTGQRLPRAALSGLGLSVMSHTAAIVVSLTTLQYIPAWHWALLLGSDACLTTVVLLRSQWFMTRNFRLPGIFVLTTSIIILVPLPATVRRYNNVVPYQTVLSIAAGLTVLSLVIYIMTARPTTERPTPPGPSEAGVTWFIVVAALVLLPIWIRAIGSVPLFALFGRTDVLTAASARDQALNSLSSGALRAAVGSLRNLYLMFAAGYLVSRTARIDRSQWRSLSRWRIIAAGVLGMTSVYSLLTTERAILGELVIVAVVSWLITRRRQLSVGHVAVSAVIGISFPVMYALLVRAGGLAVALNGLKRRIFYLPDDVMLHYFIAFPREHPFLSGGAIPKIGRLTGSPTFDLSSFIYDMYYKVEGLTGVANGSFLGVGWSNWGTLGVVA